MASVYGCADLSIAATASRDGNRGCLFPRHQSYSERLILQVTSNDRVSHVECVPDYMEKMNIEQSPLAKRAWVVQERLLAVRTLHFTATQLFWECKEKLLCEAFPSEWSYLDGARRTLGSNPSRTWRRWSEIVYDYTNAHLTYSSDKLAGIAVLARKFASLHSDQYLAGLWRSTLIRDLCWEIDYLTTQVRKRSLAKCGTIFPSWSWSSIDKSAIIMRGPELISIKQYPKLHVISLDHVADNCFGDVISARLEVETKYLNFPRSLFRDYDVDKALDGVDVREHLPEQSPNADWPTGSNPTVTSTTVTLLPMMVCLDEIRSSPKLLELMLIRSPGTRGRYRRDGISTYHVSRYAGEHAGEYPCQVYSCSPCERMKELEAFDLTITIPDVDEYIHKYVDENGDTWYRIVLD